ncbi:MAG TPA: hypothetical protein VLB83_04050 [Candidatus Paceibacterota bacterium]|nr:hypothetical protein [Candidatus Paceibacterota bacterium]
MGPFILAKDYLVWHYSRAVLDMAYVWRNYLWFLNHMFSVPEVALSLFSPFRRLQEKKVNILLHPEDYAANIVVNIMMRIVGTIMRTALLSIALILFAFVFGFGAFMFLLWFALPVLIPYFLITSLRLLFF